MLLRHDRELIKEIIPILKGAICDVENIMKELDKDEADDLVLLEKLDVKTKRIYSEAFSLSLLGSIDDYESDVEYFDF